MTDEPLERENAFREVNSAMVLLLLLLGAAFGAVILLWSPLNIHGWSANHRRFAKTSPFVLWAVLMCAQTALWLLVVVWLGPTFRRVWPATGKRRELLRLRSEALASTIAIAVVVTAFALGSSLTQGMKHRRDYMPGHEWKVGLLTGVGVFVGLFAAWGIWLVHAKLTELAERVDRKGLTSEDALHDFLIHKARLKRFLGALGAILGLLVLATAAQRQTVLAYDHKLHCTPICPKNFQPIDYGYQLVLIYGLFFSILIVVVYLPTHLSLTNFGNQIRDQFFPDVSPSAPEWRERTANREKLGSLLELDIGPLGRLKASAAILTPLISGLVGLLLK